MLYSQHSILAFFTILIHFTDCTRISKVETKKVSSNFADAAEKCTNAEENLRCGEVLNRTALVGGISYEPFATVSENERCVWTIAADSAKGYKIDVLSLGAQINSNGTGLKLILTAIQHVPSSNSTPILVSYEPTTTGQFDITDAHMIIVTFSTLSLNSGSVDGFILRYEANLLGNINPVSPNGTQHILATPTLPMRYPSNGANYGKLELATFVFPPKMNFQVDSSRSILYEKIGMECCCYDSILVYKFDTSPAANYGEWQASERICGEVESTMICHDDIVLLIFSSDNVDVRAGGFQLSSVGC